MKSQDLKIWCDYLESLSLSAKGLSLDRVKQVAKKLGLLNPNIPVITVAGTNGKGSTVAFLEAILVKQGYSVGCYTSPFLLSFNEQFRINKKNINNKNLCEYFNLIELTRNNIKLTLFEFKFLAALLFFKNNKLDLLVLEVGLGGEHDAVNIIDPTIAVITTIGLDHLDWLGNNINNIARAKAGIFRKNQKAVYGGLNPLEAILEKAEKLGTEVFYAQKDFNFKLDKKNKSNFSWKFNNKLLTNIPRPKLLISNAATALMAIELLQEMMPVSQQAICAGVEAAFVPGRQQVINQNPLVIVDVAHNEDSVKALKIFLLTQAKNKKIIAVFSALKHKELDDIIKPMSAIISEWHIASLDSPRSYDVLEIEKTIKKHTNNINTNIFIYKNIKTAYQAALKLISEQDCLVAFGSFLVVEKVLLSTGRCQAPLSTGKFSVDEL